MTDTINTVADPAHEWKQPDPVNHPGHYTSHPSGVECIQVTEHMSFCLGNAIKYIWRADLKGNAIEDLQKARWYVDREIARLGGEPAVLDQLAESGELTEAVKTSLTDALDTVLSATGVSLPAPDDAPDGTPEKPWPTWQDVPEGVEVVPTGLQERFVKIDDSAYIRMRVTDAFKRTTLEPTEFVPFVRVDGDKA